MDIELLIDDLKKKKAFKEDEILKEKEKYNIRLNDLLKTIFREQEIVIMLTFFDRKIKCLYEGKCCDYNGDNEYCVKSIELFPGELTINVIE